MAVTTFLIYAIIALASVAVVFLRKNLNYWKKRGIPHDPPHPIFGNMAGYRTKRGFGHIMADYYRKFKGTGPFAGIYLGQRPAAVLLDTPTVKQVMIKDFSNFTDRGMYYNEEEDPLTGHLFFIDGQKWRSMRNKLSPAFTSGKMKFMYPTVLKVSDQFMQVLSQRVKQSTDLDVRDLLGRFTCDIIGRVAFGIECNSFKGEEAEFMTLGRKSIEVPRHHPLVMYFIDSFPKLSRKMGMRILPEDVHQFFMNTITQTVEYREKNNIQLNDFLNILIELKNNKEDKSGLGGLTIEELAAQVFVFFLGGFETSSSTVTYALYELAQHQEMQDRLREEINEAYDKSPNLELTYETIMNLPYLNQVLSESLRKYPIVPFLTRRALNDYVVPDYPKYSLEKDTMLIIPTLGIHHDPELYPNPEEFDPERFSEEMVKQRDSVEYLGFGDGPRNCIGMRFGKMQSRLAMASILRRFRVSLSSKTQGPLVYDPLAPTLNTKHSIYLKVEAI